MREEVTTSWLSGQASKQDCLVLTADLESHVNLFKPSISKCFFSEGCYQDKIRGH
jgi:hypothetical protein